MAKLDEKKKVLEVIDPFNNDLFDEDPKVVDGEIIVSEENPFTVEFDPEFLNVTASDYDDEFGEEESKSDAEEALDVIKDKLDIEVEDDLLVVSEKGQSDNPDAPKVETEITEEEAEIIGSEFDVEPEVQEEKPDEDSDEVADEEENSTEDSDKSEEDESDEEDDDADESEELDEALLLEGNFFAKVALNSFYKDKGFTVVCFKEGEIAPIRKSFKKIDDALNYAKAWSKKAEAGDDGAVVYGGTEIGNDTLLASYINGAIKDDQIQNSADLIKAGKKEIKAEPKPAEQPKPEEAAAAEQNSTEEEKPVGEQPAAAEASTEEKPAATGKGATLNKRVEMNKKIVKALDDVKPGLATELGLATTNDKGRLKGTEKLTSLRKALFGESIEAFDEDFEESYPDMPFDSDTKVSDKVRIIHLAGESTEYDGREGTVEHIDSIGQLHGTWGGLAIIPGVDEYEIITESLNEEAISQEPRGLETIVLAKEFTLSDKVICIKGDKAGAKMPVTVYIKPFTASGDAGNNINKVFVGHLNGKTDYTCYFNDESEAMHFLEQCLAICPEDITNLHMARADKNTAGYAIVKTEFGDAGIIIQKEIPTPIDTVIAHYKKEESLKEDIEAEANTHRPCWSIEFVGAEDGKFFNSEEEARAAFKALRIPEDIPENTGDIILWYLNPDKNNYDADVMLDYVRNPLGKSKEELVALGILESLNEGIITEKPEGDKIESYNNGLKLAKLYGKPVIYGYTNKLLGGKYFALGDPIVCDDVNADSNKFRAQYKGCSVIYIAYPDKAFIEDEEKKQEIQDLINFDKKIEN